MYWSLISSARPATSGIGRTTGVPSKWYCANAVYQYGSSRMRKVIAPRMWSNTSGWLHSFVDVAHPLNSASGEKQTA